MVGSFVLFLFIFARAAFHSLLSLGNSRVGGNETFSLKLEVLFSDFVVQISIVGTCLVYFNIFKSSHKPNRTFEKELYFPQK